MAFTRLSPAMTISPKALRKLPSSITWWGWVGACVRSDVPCSEGRAVCGASLCRSATAASREERSSASSEVRYASPCSGSIGFAFCGINKIKKRTDKNTIAAIPTSKMPIFIFFPMKTSPSKQSQNKKTAAAPARGAEFVLLLKLYTMRQKKQDGSRNFMKKIFVSEKKKAAFPFPPPGSVGEIVFSVQRISRTARRRSYESLMKRRYAGSSRIIVGLRFNNTCGCVISGSEAP